MKICPKCNAQNGNTAPVCKHCGENLNETPDVEISSEPEEKTPYNLNLSILFLALSFAVSTIKMLFKDAETEVVFPAAYFICVVLGIVFLIAGLFCMRGLLKTKPIPGKGIFVIMISIIVSFLVLMDVFSVGQSLILGHNEAKISERMEIYSDEFDY